MGEYLWHFNTNWWLHIRLLLIHRVHSYWWYVAVKNEQDLFSWKCPNPFHLGTYRNLLKFSHVRICHIFKRLSEGRSYSACFFSLLVFGHKHCPHNQLWASGSWGGHHVLLAGARWPSPWPRPLVSWPYLKGFHHGQIACWLKASKSREDGEKEPSILGKPNVMSRLWMVSTICPNTFHPVKPGHLQINCFDLLHPPHLSMIPFIKKKKILKYN